MVVKPNFTGAYISFFIQLTTSVYRVHFHTCASGAPDRDGEARARVPETGAGERWSSSITGNAREVDE